MSYEPMRKYWELIEQLQKLDSILPPGELVITGGAALVARGIRQDCKDLDIIASPKLWANLARGFPVDANYLGGESKRIQVRDHIEVFDRVDVPISTGSPLTGNEKRFTRRWEKLLADAEFVDGFRLHALEDMFKMKSGMGRPKDREDAKLIGAMLGWYDEQGS